MNENPSQNTLCDAFSELWTSIRVYVEVIVWLMLFIPVILIV